MTKKRTRHAMHTAGNNERKDELAKSYCADCVHYNSEVPPYSECKANIVPRLIVPEGVLTVDEIHCRSKKER